MKITLFCIDIDGTMTDGKIYIGANGEIMKAFNVKDGFGIHDILPQCGIVPVIITGRNSEIVKSRAAELGVTEMYQGIQNKAACVQYLLGKYSCTSEDVAYIGDDLQDIPAMEQCGIRGCPADAVQEVKEISDYVCNASGGCGAVREFIEWLIHTEKI